MSLRIVFMGTPEFATTILRTLIEKNENVVGVVTAPDKPAGRGRKLRKSDVKKYAETQQLNVLQPTNLKDEVFIQQLSDLQADVFVVVAFRMLPEVVWKMPPKGTFNLHASILPQYRGAAPINWAIINGEKETGVTTFFIEQEIDTGAIIEQERILIGENETIGSLYERLMNLGAKTVVNTLKKIQSSTKSELGVSQEKMIVKPLLPAPKIFKDDCRIDFEQTAQNVHNFIRGLDPYPGAWTILKNKSTGEKKTVKLFASEKVDLKLPNAPVIAFTKNGFLFPCADKFVLIKEIQMEGKKRMDYKSFEAGNSIDEWGLSF